MSGEPILVGTQNFETLRINNIIYVNKTGYLPELLA
jgi:hypothetical protein